LRFEQYGRKEDLDEAIALNRQAAKLAPAGHPAAPVVLNNLSTMLDLQSERQGEDSDLDEAIVCYREAIKLMSPPDANRSLINLATALRSRFRRYGDSSDLEESITSCRQALDLTRPGDALIPSILNNLALSLHSRFERDRVIEDLEEAITNFRKAIQVVPAGHSHLPRFLSNLGIMLDSRFHQLKDHQDLKEEMTYFRMAVDLTPAGSPGLSFRLNNLAGSLLKRYAQSEHTEGLDEAIGYQRHVIRLAPPDHANLPTWLHNLALSLKLRSITERGNPADIEEAISVTSRGSKLTTGSVSLRFKCAVTAAKLAHDSGRLPVALDAYSRAVSLLGQVAWLGQSVASRQNVLAKESSGLSANAAACAIELGDIKTAVELLDHGRSIFWSQAMDTGADLTELKEVNPSLAEKLEGLARLLEDGAFQDPFTGVLGNCQGEVTLEGTRKNRRDLTRDWELLLDEVRKHPGFQNFLLPLPFSRLRSAALGGAVVILNVSSYRCDALIVTQDKPRPELVPLPSLSLKRTTELMKTIQAAQNIASPSSIQCRYLPPILRELWDKIGGVICPVLGYTIKVGERSLKPRVWWCPTGPLTFLPIHAMGPYTKHEPDLAQMAVSSYTNTLVALIRARTRRTYSNGPRILAVGQANTPGQKALPKVTVEVDSLRQKAKTLGIPFVSLEGSEGVRIAVMESLNCAHFACHGHQESSTAVLGSALFLEDGPLTLSTIASTRLPNADFTFLSACRTASGSNALPDEAMHIAAGMMIAGFRSIVATTWTISDDTGSRVANGVYDQLLHSAPASFNPSDAAHCLNAAVLQLRKGPSKVTAHYWAPFIHIGV
jgi:tetratricopeptide (TPR) repeat protein